MTYEVIKSTMIEAVEKANEIIRGDFNDALNNQTVSTSDKDTKNGLPDFVTETDKKAEDAINASLSRELPNIPFVGEECGGDLSQDRFFLVDPLDGTSNFASLRDYFCICAAYVENGEVVAAVIGNPMTGEIVSASKGNGAFLNGQKIDLDANDCDDIQKTQLECEVPFANADDFTLAAKIIPSMSGMRKSGSTALDIFNIVKGRNIVCVSSGLEPHDIAACTLIMREANGAITDFSGNDATYKTTELVAGSKKKQLAVLRLINS